MKKQPEELSASELHRRAEGKLSDRQVAIACDEVDVLRLPHKLQFHQIELEMQNRQPRYAQSKIEAALSRVTDLDEFAPNGYFTLGLDGTIYQTNLKGTALLGLERANITGTRLISFVRADSNAVSAAVLNNAFLIYHAGPQRAECKLTLVCGDGAECHAHVEGLRTTQSNERV